MADLEHRSPNQPATSSRSSPHRGIPAQAWLFPESERRMSRYLPDCERRQRFRWNASADRELRQLYGDGYVISMMARQLNVTSSAIKNRIHKLNLKRNFYRRPLTEKEI